MYKLKWPEGFRCPDCGHKHAYLIGTRRLPLYQCSACDTQTSLIAGTVMQGSRTPLRLWFQAISLHTRPEGVNAVQLSQAIKVTYKTAWLICHKIRHAMQRQNCHEMLTGLIRITDAKLFPRTTGSSAWHEQEQSVFVAASADEAGQIERIKIKKQNKHVLKNCYESPKVEPFISEVVDPNLAEKVTVSRHYFGGKRDYVLLNIAQKAQNALARTFRGVSPKHLQVYLDQFCYVFNRVNRPLLQELRMACSSGPCITYPALIGATAATRYRFRKRKTMAWREAS
ncbi:transposase [Cohnella pontilimi]|uniref:transposase n=1 Tax=Cohnella pontilimi TaxID=2564100 RepID=UPI00145E957A